MKVSAELYQELMSIARWTVFDVVSESAQNNVTDAVAAQAVLETVTKIEAGEDIRNPQGFVTTVAKRRALDARDSWARHRHARLMAEGDEARDGDHAGIYFSMMSDQLAAPLDGGLSGEGVLDWFLEVMERAGLDVTDQKIAKLVFFDGEKPEAVAERVGLAEKTVRNRMTIIEKTVRQVIETGESS